MDVNQVGEWWMNPKDKWSQCVFTYLLMYWLIFCTLKVSKLKSNLQGCQICGKLAVAHNTKI